MNPVPGSPLPAASHCLDVRGKECPVPALEARACLDNMRPDDILEVQATDPLAGVDLRILCERLGHDLFESREHAGVFRFWIRVSAGRPSAAG